MEANAELPIPDNSHADRPDAPRPLLIFSLFLFCALPHALDGIFPTSLMKMSEQVELPICFASGQVLKPKALVGLAIF